MAITATYELSCDGSGCMTAYQAAFADTWSEYAIKKSAKRDGWQIRPEGGRGSRSVPYLCPECRKREPA